MEKECEICGVFFEARRSNQKYCPECSRKSGREKIRMQKNIKKSINRCGTGMTRKPQENRCKNCGCDFTTYEWHPGECKRDFCSSKCRIEYVIKHTTCATCQKPMTDTDDQHDPHGHLWFCSEECKEKHHWKVAREQGLVKTCPECGKEFIKNTKFCGRDCYLAYQKKHGYQREQNQQTVVRHCMVCNKVFDCHVDQMMFPLCSDACKEQHRLSIKRKAEQKEQAKRNADLLKQQKYIEKNGLCSICRTSYVDCERMQSNFRMSPKGSVFKGSVVVKCPKFTGKKGKAC